MAVSRSPKQQNIAGQHRLQTYRHTGYATVADPTNVGGMQAASLAPEFEAQAGWGFDSGTTPYTPVWIESVFNEDTQSWSYHYFDAPGGTAYSLTGNIAPEAMEADVEVIQHCYQDVDDRSIRYTEILFVDTTNPANIVATTWLDEAGNMMSSPASNVVRCEDELPLSDCISGGGDFSFAGIVPPNSVQNSNLWIPIIGQAWADASVDYPGANNSITPNNDGLLWSITGASSGVNGVYEIDWDISQFINCSDGVIINSFSVNISIKNAVNPQGGQHVIGLFDGSGSIISFNGGSSLSLTNPGAADVFPTGDFVWTLTPDTLPTLAELANYSLGIAWENEVVFDVDAVWVDIDYTTLCEPFVDIKTVHTSLCNTQDITGPIITALNSTNIQETLYLAVSQDQYNVSDVVPIALFPPIGSVGCSIQYIATSLVAGQRSGEFWFTINGTNPSSNIGNILSHKDITYLGNTAETPHGDPTELSGYQVIAEPGTTGYIYITYYQKTCVDVSC